MKQRKVENLMTNMKYAVLLLLFLFKGITGFAQEQDFVRFLQGSVVDFVTNEALVNGTTVQLLSKDSTFVSDGSIFPDNRNYQLKALFSVVVEAPGEYILKFENPSYHTAYRSVTVGNHKREMDIKVGIVPMRYKLPDDAVALNEVVVNAPKVKFYFNKDTLVYNAEAFVTQRGFMLDDIIHKMPGIEMGAGGEIRVNGRKVDALLLNGKDFFNNDRQTLLANMPAFAVKSLKAYDKTRDSLSPIQRERDFNGYVLDVKLKKGYEHSFVGNADIGYGTSGRYYGRLFGMRYSPLSRLSAYVVTNNINRDETVSEVGELRDMGNGNGNNKNTKAGINYNIDHPRGLYALNGNANLNYRDLQTTTNTAASTFLTGGDVFSRTTHGNKIHSLSLSTTHDLNIYGHSESALSIRPTFNYEKNVGHTDYITASFDRDIDDLWGKTWVDSLLSIQQRRVLEEYGITRQIYRDKSNAYAWMAGMDVSRTIKIPHTEDVLALSGNYKYHRLSQRQFAQQGIDYLRLSQADWQNRYTRTRQTDWQYKLGTGYTLNLNFLHSLTLGYSFSHTNLDYSQPTYALHELEGWGTQAMPTIGLLPSHEEMLRAMDMGNSYSYAQKTDEHQLNIEYKYVETPAGGKTELTLKLPLTLERKELDFFQQDNDATVHRHRYRPEVFVEFLKNRYFPKGSFLLYSLQYTLKSDMPTLTNLVRFKNDMNPLVIFEGNPGLKDSYAHGFFGQLLWQSNKAYVQRMNLSYDIYTNMLANAQVYDRTTGVRHLTPMNVNGNWLLRLNVANSLYVSGNRLSSIGNEVTFLWQNSADYSSGSASTLSDKRIVRNFSVMERMNFSWMSRNTRVRNEGFLYVNHSRATCREEGFERISTTDYGLQDQVTAELPWNLRLTSSILAVFRAGYSAADMNDEEFIWNANLAKSFGERYSVSLELYDMLNQRKNIYHYVNAQGNTDVFYNNMRRYAMLHFTMRLSKTKQPR